MKKPNDHITVGIITLSYSHILNGWVMPDGSVNNEHEVRK
ncbi:DUF1317 family protein [Pantoea anthophila]|nr:DUF1317 family protein [Pantoea anthophila]WIM56134.1 DUF1317 family protein [Pantoea anthophila]